MNYAVLALILAVAMLGPLLALSPRLRLPVVVGELIVGMALGAAGVLDAQDGTFRFLADIGFALIMFVAGTNVPMRGGALRHGAVRGVVRAVLVGVASVPIALGIAYVFGTDHAPLYAVVIASSSSAVVMPSIEGMESRTGMAELIPQVAIADAAAIILLPLAVEPSNAVRSAFGAVMVVAAGVLVWAGLRWAEQTGIRKRVHDTSKEEGFALELRVILCLLFGLSALAQLGHVSVLLAGFTLGVAVSAVGEPKRLARQVFGLTQGFFGPIFFVWLGASMNIAAVLESPNSIGLGIVLGLGAIVAHLVGIITRQSVPMALLSAAALGVPAAAAAVGSQLGVLGPGEAPALLLGSLVTLAGVTLAASRLRRQKDGAGAPVELP